MEKELLEKATFKKNRKLSAILLFTEKDPVIVKLLKDADFINALDSLSGEKIDVYYTKLVSGELGIPERKGNEMSFMVPIWKEPKQNEELFSLFKIKDSRELPMLILFGTNIIEDGKEISFYKKLKIKESGEVDAWKSIEESLYIALDVLKDLQTSSSEITNELLEKELTKKVRFTQIKKWTSEITKRLPVGAVLGRLI
ncbi:hypothetical protein [Oceanobacillus sp. CAU 1775]